MFSLNKMSLGPKRYRFPVILLRSYGPFVVHGHDDWVFTLLHDMCSLLNLVRTPAHYPSDVKKRKKSYIILDFTLNLSKPLFSFLETEGF